MSSKLMANRARRVGNAKMTVTNIVEKLSADAKKQQGELDNMMKENLKWLESWTTENKRQLEEILLPPSKKRRADTRQNGSLTPNLKYEVHTQRGHTKEFSNFPAAPSWGWSSFTHHEHISTRSTHI